MMNNIFEQLFSNSVSREKKHELFLSSIKFVGSVGAEPSYAEIIQKLLPIIQKNIETFETKNIFEENHLKEYMQKYEEFRKETLKYQIWLKGSLQECQEVERILNFDKVHLLGKIDIGENKIGSSHYDYVIVCSDILGTELAGFDRDKIVRYDFLRFCHYGVSPETAYLDMKLRRKINARVEGAVTGLSYQQVGLDYEKLKRNMVCLAAPSQDLYLDYHNFMWLYDEIVNKRQGLLKYCVVGMDFYRLWFDISMSNNRKIRMLPFYKRLRCVHHCHDFDIHLMKAEEDWKICEELMIDNYLDVDYVNNVHPEQLYIKHTDQYKISENTYAMDGEKIKKIFNKPYPLTFQENIGLLEQYLKFLYMHHVKTLIYIPPFPKIFNDFTNQEMKKTTIYILRELQKKYEYEILDLSSNELFTDEYFKDWSHLNCYGADLATDILNNYMDEIWGEAD